METWRLLDTGSRSAAENMCLDEALLKTKEAGIIPNTLRFMKFRPHCVLVGFHQSVEQEVRDEFCRQEGIEINRRISGGGAIYLGEEELGWELVADKVSIMNRWEISHAYKLLCEAGCQGLQKIGLPCSYRPLNDIEVEGRKISGAGGGESGSAFLFHGSILVNFDLRLMLGALHIPVEKLVDKGIGSFRERVTSIAWELEKVPPGERIKSSMAESFAEMFHVNFSPGGLTDWETEYMEENLSKFLSPSWIYKIKRPLEEEQILEAQKKAPGGLIRVSLLVNEPRNILKMALITGDFFAYPKNTILDLEARLKNLRCDRIEESIINFFKERQPIIPGVSSGDLVSVFQEALGK